MIINQSIFYHGGHLGSASWITDANGYPVQHLQYLPFGEPFVDQHSTGSSEMVKNDGVATHKSPLREPQALVPFTGKERDSETGYSYFGARYYDSELSGLFLSVDPMADKYPIISPYHYCHWNPIRLVDPDGQDDWEVDKLGHITRCQEQPKNPTEDRIRVKGTDGWNEKNSISGLTKGTIAEQKKWNLNGEHGSLIQLGGTYDNRVELFKFCADNSNVEFSLIELDNGVNQMSLLTTSHDVRAVGKDYIGDALGSEIAKQNAPILQSHTHNHFGNGEYGWGASSADISFRDEIYSR